MVLSAATFFTICLIFRVKRGTEQLNNTSDASKKAKLSAYSKQHPTQSVPFSPQSPSQNHNQSQPDLQILSQSHQIPHSQTSPQLLNQKHQQPQKRGPGRPKKQNAIATNVLSPTMDASTYEMDVILSPPSVDRRRRSVTQKTKSADGLASPPPISTIKTGSFKSRRRPSKKDQATTDQEILPMMSPSARSGSVTLSPSPQQPSPVRTPGSTSGVSFTHSKDLTVNISDLDKLFEGSDDEGEHDHNVKVRRPFGSLCFSLRPHC